MKGLTRSIAVLPLGFAVVLSASAPAHAERGGDIAAGIIGGAILGTILGSQANQRPTYREPQPIYGEPRPGYRGCRELRERALHAEDRGRFERARHLWREYRYCRGG